MIVNKSDIEGAKYEKVSVQLPVLDKDGKIEAGKTVAATKERMVINSAFPCGCGKFGSCFRHGVSPNKKQNVVREK